jgi:hypothetical protein
MTHEPKSAATGYVYALVNSSMPGLVKIGCSTNHPLERARQLSASTSAATPFVVAFQRHISFPFRAEAAIHVALADYRINDSREFFRIPLHKAIEQIERFDEIPECAPRRNVEEMALPWAELFSSFRDDGSDRTLDEQEQALCRDLAHRLRTGQVIH